jgi:hypothetical protein
MCIATFSASVNDADLSEDTVSKKSKKEIYTNKGISSKFDATVISEETESHIDQWDSSLYIFLASH